MRKVLALLMLSTPCWGQVAISGLPSASAMNDMDIFPATQGSTTRGVTGAQIRGAVSSIRDVRNYSGADLGEKIAACFATIPTLGATCDARYISGSLNFINSTVTVPNLGTLLLGQAEITSSVLPVFEACDYSSILGTPETVIYGPGGDGAMLVGCDPVNSTNGIYISDVRFTGVVDGVVDGSIGFDFQGVYNSRLIRVRGTKLDIPLRLGGTYGAFYDSVYDSVFQGVTASVLIDANAIHNQFYSSKAGPGIRGVYMTEKRLVFNSGSGEWEPTTDGPWPGNNTFVGLDIEGSSGATINGIDIKGGNNLFLGLYIEASGINIQAGSVNNRFVGDKIPFPDMTALTAAEVLTNSFCSATACYQPKTSIGGVPISIAGADNLNLQIGELALRSNTTGSRNVAGGNGCMEFNTSGDRNTCWGQGALQGNTDKDFSTAVGAGALNSSNGEGNTAIGKFAGYATNPVTTGQYNTFLGTNTGLASASQVNNSTCIGAGCLLATSNTIQLGTADEITIIPPNTVGNLPACGASLLGAMKTVSDALAPSVGSTVVGGGSAKAMAWCNGANWTVMGI